MGNRHCYNVRQDAVCRSEISEISRVAQLAEMSCKVADMQNLNSMRGKMIFPTGSKFLGHYNAFGMVGQGKYKFPNYGVKYKGDFKNGSFNGDGDLIYPDGMIITGNWSDGICKEAKLSIGDGFKHSSGDEWTYCTPEDRRFMVERNNGLKPAGDTYKTNQQPTPVIPPGMYDTIDGFYDPKRKIIVQQDDLNEILRIPSAEECQFIEDYFRYSEDRCVGPKADIYEEWVLPNSDNDCRCGI